MKFTLLSLLLFCSFISFSQNKQQRVDSLKKVVSQTSGDKKLYQLLELSKAYRGVAQDSSIITLNKMEKLGYPWESDSLNFYFEIEKSIAHKRDGNFDLALASLEASKEFINNESIRNADYHQNKAFTNYDQGNFTDAREQFENSLKYLNEETDVKRIIGVYNNIASCEQQLGNYEAAIKLNQKTINLAQEQNMKESESKAYNNISILYKKLENFEKAEEFITKAIELDKTFPTSPRSNAVGYLNLGLIQRAIAEKNGNEEKYDEVRKNYKKALEISEENQIKDVKGAVLANFANLENTLKNYDKAIELGKKAQDFNIKTGNTYGEMITTLNLGESYRGAKQFANAERELDKSLVLAEKMKFQEGIQAVYNTQMLLYEDSRQFEKAFMAQKRHTKLTDSLESVQVKNNINELEVKFETEKKEKDLAETRANLAETELKVKNRNNLIYGSLGLALILGLLGYLLYNQQKLKNRQLKKEAELSTALARIETQNRLQEQRLRISSDLHDNIGAQLTFIISSIDNLKFGMKDAKEATKNRLSKISEFTTQTIYELRDTIWAMNKEDISFEDLQVRISNFIEKAKVASEKIEFSFTIEEEVDKGYTFTSVEGMNIYRIIQESVNNALKHAEAKNIVVKISEADKNKLIEILDDGEGFNVDEVAQGNGLNSLKKRTKELDGFLEIKSAPNDGTLVKLKLKK